MCDEVCNYVYAINWSIGNDDATDKDYHTLYCFKTFTDAYYYLINTDIVKHECMHTDTMYYDMVNKKAQGIFYLLSLEKALESFNCMYTDEYHYIFQGRKKTKQYKATIIYKSPEDLKIETYMGLSKLLGSNCIPLKQIVLLFIRVRSKITYVQIGEENKQITFVKHEVPVFIKIRCLENGMYSYKNTDLTTGITLYECIDYFNEYQQIKIKNMDKIVEQIHNKTLLNIGMEGFSSKKNIIHEELIIRYVN